MGIKQGALAVAILGIVFASIGALLLLLGQETPLILLWIAMTFGGCILLIIGIHILLASILTYLRARRDNASKTLTPS